MLQVGHSGRHHEKSSVCGVLDNDPRDVSLWYRQPGAHTQILEMDSSSLLGEYWMCL